MFTPIQTQAGTALVDTPMIGFDRPNRIAEFLPPIVPQAYGTPLTAGVPTFAPTAMTPYGYAPTGFPVHQVPTYGLNPTVHPFGGISPCGTVPTTIPSNVYGMGNIAPLQGINPALQGINPALQAIHPALQGIHPALHPLTNQVIPSARYIPPVNQGLPMAYSPITGLPVTTPTNLGYDRPMLTHNDLLAGNIPSPLWNVPTGLHQTTPFGMVPQWADPLMNLRTNPLAALSHNVLGLPGIAPTVDPITAARINADLLNLRTNPLAAFSPNTMGLSNIAATVDPITAAKINADLLNLRTNPLAAFSPNALGLPNIAPTVDPITAAKINADLLNLRTNPLAAFSPNAMGLSNIAATCDPIVAAQINANLLNRTIAADPRTWTANVNPIASVPTTVFGDPCLCATSAVDCCGLGNVLPVGFDRQLNTLNPYNLHNVPFNTLAGPVAGVHPLQRFANVLGNPLNNPFGVVNPLNVPTGISSPFHSINPIGLQNVIPNITGNIPNLAGITQPIGNPLVCPTTPTMAGNIGFENRTVPAATLQAAAPISAPYANATCGTVACI